MASELMNFIQTLEEIGVYEVALPFILIFTLIFALLQRVKIFGDGGKNFNMIIAAVFALLVVRQPYIIGIMNEFLPQVSIIALVLMVLLLLSGIVMGPFDEHRTYAVVYIGIAISIIGIAWAFLSSANIAVWPWLSELYRHGDLNVWIFVGLALVFILIATADGTGRNTVGSVVDHFISGFGNRRGGNT